MTTSTLIFVCIPVSTHTGVCVYLNAQTGATLDAPVLVGNTIESLSTTALMETVLAQYSSFLRHTACLAVS